MQIEKATIKCEAIFNDDRTHRYLWKRVWSKDKPIAAVIMLNPCISDTIVTDTTTTLTVNNIALLETYGGVVILNLFSRLTNKLNFRWNSDEDLNDPENDDFIRKTAADCETVILAWGRAADHTQRISDRAHVVLEQLKPFADKLFLISDGERCGLHPLTPSIRSHWQLVPFRCEETITESTEQAER